MLTEVSAPSTPHGGPPQSCQAEPDTRRTPLRTTRPGGYAQVLRRPFARLCAGLRHDERGALLWLLIEANRRHWGRPGTPVLTISKTGLAEALAITRRRAARIVDRLIEVGAVAWSPGPGPLDGRLEVLVYDQVVADGRRERGTNYCAVLCGPVDDALGALGFDAWAVLALAAVEVGSVTRTIAGPVEGMAAHFGLSRHRLRAIVEGLARAGLVEWRSRTATGARLRLTSYADVARSGTAAVDRGEVCIDAAGHVLGALTRAAATPGIARQSEGLVAGIARLSDADSRGLPAVSSPFTRRATRRTTTTSTTPPIARECSTPPPPKIEGGQTKQAPRVVDHDHPDADAFLDELLDAVCELAEDAGDDRSGPRLAHALDARTRAVRALRLRASERLAAGWTPRDLAAETLGSRDLLGASHVDAVLASRLDALPVKPDLPPRTESAGSGRDLREAIADACELDRASMPGAARSTLARVAAELRDVGADVDEVYDRAKNYRSTWPDATLTPHALAKHWAQLGTPSRAEPPWSPPPVVVIEGEPPEAAYGPFVSAPAPTGDGPAVVRPEDADPLDGLFDRFFGAPAPPPPPAWVELDDGTVARAEAPAALSPVPVDAAVPSYALPAVIEVEGRAPEPSAPDPDDASGRPGRDPSPGDGADPSSLDRADPSCPTSADPSPRPGGDPSPGDDLDPSPASTTDAPPSPPAPAWARQAPPPAIEATPTGDRTSGPLEDAYGGPEATEAPPDLAALFDAGRASVRGGAGPRRAFDALAPRRPVGAGGRDASSGPPATKYADDDRLGLRARANEQERARKRLRALGLSA